MVSRLVVANISSIGKEGQSKLSNSCIGVAGLGGVGGIAFELLVRAGVGKIKVSDGGFFEQSNANRQSLWSIQRDGRQKVEVAEEFAKQTNPSCKIEKYGKISKSNSAAFASGCNAVIDATDTAFSRKAVFSGCKKEGVPYIFASARESRGMLCVFRGKDMAKEFGLARRLPKGLPCDHALGPVSNCIGCLAAQQAINIVVGKPALLFPKVLLFDAFSCEPFSIF
ncbi:MAG: ThiF family adenylyltransferase [Candidatus Anstonellaceae archaeon]